MSDLTIEVRENGPYKIRGPVSIVDAAGVPFEIPPGTAVALCRCGHSGNKPFCDSSHRRVGWVAVESAPRAPEHEEGRPPDGPLSRELPPG